MIELDYGEWDGLALADVPAGRLGGVARRSRSSRRPAASASSDVTARVARVLRRRADATISSIAVSHVSPIKAAVCGALQVDERVTWRMQLDVASVTRIGRRPDGSAYLAGVQRRVIVSALNPA